MPNIFILGAGPATGLATARRFAREGYAVGLIARRPDALAALRDPLVSQGAHVATAVADLTDADGTLAALATLETELGPPDVVLYSPGDVSRRPVRASDLDGATLQTWLPLHLTTPVSVAHAVLPALRERRRGALIFAQGIAVRYPTPEMASVATAQAALLHYLRALAAEVAEAGVRVTSLQIGQLIESSAAARLFDDGHFAGIEDGALPRISPGRLADLVWQAVTGPAEVEIVS